MPFSTEVPPALGGTPVRDVASPLRPGLVPLARLAASSLWPGAASRLQLSSSASP